MERWCFEMQVSRALHLREWTELFRWNSHFKELDIDGSGLERYISNMLYSQDVPFWSGTLDIVYDLTYLTSEHLEKKYDGAVEFSLVTDIGKPWNYMYQDWHKTCDFRACTPNIDIETWS